MAEEQDFDTGAAMAQAGAPMTPGARLRAGREAQGLSIQDVATRTRIAQRQLEAVERDDYMALPGIPYAVGFARAYARAIGMDEVAIAADVRHAISGTDLGANRYEAFEPLDPARVPPRRLAWAVAALVILLIAAYAIWRTQVFTPPSSEQIAAQDRAPAMAQRPAGAPVAAAAPQTVLFTAVDDVWLRIYDEAGERLKDGLMKKGERFELPANARNPMILTGRPQALAVTVGGKPVAPLGEADRTIADVPVSAGALLARGTPAPAATTTPAPAAAPPRRAPPAAPRENTAPTAGPDAPATTPSPTAPAPSPAG